MPYPYYQGYPNYNPYFQQLQSMQQPQQQNMQQSSPQIQNGGFVIVKDINEAMQYPVAHGNSVTFKDENQPYIYTKTLGFSQLDQPIFETFKLVKEDFVETSKTASEIINGQFLTLDEGNALKVELDAVKSELQFLKELIEDDKKEVISA